MQMRTLGSAYTEAVKEVSDWMQFVSRDSSCSQRALLSHFGEPDLAARNASPVWQQCSGKNMALTCQLYQCNKHSIRPQNARDTLAKQSYVGCGGAPTATPTSTKASETGTERAYRELCNVRGTEK